MDWHVAQLVRSAVAIVHCGHHNNLPIWQRSAHTHRSSVRLVRNTDGVGANGQMRAMLLDHSHWQDEQCLLTVKGVNLRPAELLKPIDSRAESGALALRSLTSGHGRPTYGPNDQHDERLLHKSLLRRGARPEKR